MLQESILRDIVDALATAAVFSTVKFGSSSVPPKKIDGGLLGTELANAAVTVENDDGVVKVTTDYFTIPSGVAQEVCFFGSDGEAKDRTLVQPITGGANVRLAIEYYLEPIADV